MFHYQTVEELRQAAQEEGVTLPLGGDLSPLGQELEVQGVKLPNRVAIQPMEGCDGTADGKPGELTLRRYDKFARSGRGCCGRRPPPSGRRPGPIPGSCG